MFVAGKDVSFGELLKKFPDLGFMGEASGKRGVDAEDDRLMSLVTDQGEVLAATRAGRR